MKIKYRGLDYDKKTWHYGLPTYLIEENCDDGTIDGIRTDWETNEDIIPETLGRYTGFKDMNGKEIYEGDWIRCGYIAVVVYDESQAAFISRYKHPEDGEDLLLCDLGKEIEVIGNIHSVN